MSKFQPVSPQVDLPAMEQGVLRFWQWADVFDKTLAQTADGPRYVFYEGPPTANGRPGIHHVLARVFKDIFPRYKTMRGYYVSRKGGWDTHGLPVELEVEKKLGFSGKKAIEEYGIAAFNQKCRQSVFEYVEDWEKLTERHRLLGRSADRVRHPDQRLHRVAVVDPEAVLGARSDLPGLQGRALLPALRHAAEQPRAGAGLPGRHADPSVYVQFPLRDQPGDYLLVWTTTPWTLPGNVAVAVGEEIDYVLVEHGDDQLWLAEALVRQGLRQPRRARRESCGGSRAASCWAGTTGRSTPSCPSTEDYCYVISGDFVSTEDGTGIVHIAPAFGADDMEVGQKFRLPTLMTVDAQGRFIDAVTPWRGIFVKDADPLIQQELTERGLMFKQGIYEHTYPFCWRCDTPLLYYRAHAPGTSRPRRSRSSLLANNQQINWVPEHIRDGRFGDWLENNIDWGLARERYWGTPLPFWVCDNPACGHQECIGSVAELSENGTQVHEPALPGAADGRWPDPDQTDASRSTCTGRPWTS